MPFKKGTSGNPAGKLKGTLNKVVPEIREAAKAHGPAALLKLVSLIKSKDERVAITACTAILDRGYGRPAQNVDVKGGFDIVVEIVRFIEGTGPTIEGEIAEPVAAEALPVKALALP